MAFPTYPTIPDPWPDRAQWQAAFDDAISATFTFFDNLETWSVDWQTEAQGLAAALVAANLPDLSGNAGDAIIVNGTGDGVTFLSVPGLGSANTFTGTNNFTGALQQDGVGLLKLSGGSMSGGINMSNNGIIMGGSGTIEWSTDDYVVWDTGVGFRGFENGAQAFRLGSSQETIIASVGSNTTASAANVNVTEAGILRRSTSSGVYKTNLVPVEGDVILSLRPVKFTSKHAADGDGRYAGFIAEEVGEAFPEASADDGENYDVRAIVSALVAKVQSQHDEIQSLKDRIEALEASA